LEQKRKNGVFSLTFKADCKTPFKERLFLFKKLYSNLKLFSKTKLESNPRLLKSRNDL